MDTKHDRIVDAAWQLFLSHGYRKVSMSDIADAAQMSRPSLYAAFDNKDAICSALVHRQRDKQQRDTVQRLRGVEGLRERLACVFEVWVVEPAAAATGAERGADLLGDCAAYAPEAMADLHAHFEAHLAAVMRPALGAAAAMPAQELAFVLRVASTGNQSAMANLPKLRRLIAGLVNMTIASVQ